MNLRKLSFLGILALAALPASMEAQGGTCSIATSASSCTSAQTVTASMPQIATMTLTGDVNLTTPTAGDFVGDQAVMTDASAGTVTIKANKVYSLTVQANAANFTPGLGGSGSTKPAGDLEVKLDAAAYQALSTSAVTIASAQTKTSSRAHAISYRTTYKMSQDNADSYTLALTYSLTTP